MSRALPIFLGRTLDKTTVVVTDGGPALCNSVDAAIHAGLVGLCNAVRRRCFFHGCLQTFLNDVEIFCLSKSPEYCPLRRALDICRLTRRLATDKDDVTHAMTCVRSSVDAALLILGSAGKAAVQQWFTRVESLQDRLFPAANPGVLTFGEATVSPVEGEHADIKSKRHNSRLSGVSKQMSTAGASQREDQRQTLRGITRRKHQELELSKCLSVKGVPDDIAASCVRVVVLHLQKFLEQEPWEVQRVGRQQLIAKRPRP